ncbi:BamA/TamA family outer membrane protein [Scytonema sp. UIC 10036]|uniref:ShlB/FhaC/HecB family hemolysin secretion/activation protein n=1 Tax=Scytonema sp. UIC 10036 TaxID=2304196 RepID=UPI0012DA5C79|nr:ShlB/FhaC/HecB family hemolysin secretion/activation protein [Scytonema sp. UIC 10036]MUG94299.1 BamA/TamA family outer membrane protein [Scytonema sp. UIC 10036]
MVNKVHIALLFLPLLPLVLILNNTSSAWAQSINPNLPIPSEQIQPINPVTPLPPEQQEPNLLPPQEEPLQLPPIAPPFPEEIQNVPRMITVERFEFVGSTVFNQEELNQVTGDFIGEAITFDQLLQAANKVSELYIKKGYITSGAYIPSQEIQSGTVKIQILEGSLEEIKVNIAKGRLNPNYVRSRIAIATSKPLNVNRLQEALQLLQLNPLIESLDAELTAGTKPGTNSLEVTVRGAKTFSTEFRIDNNRNPAVGSLERGIEIAEANLLGLGDRLSFAYSNTDGSNRFEGSYTLPINPRNGTLRFDYRTSDNNIIEPPFEDADIEVDSREFELTFRQPIIQTATPQRSQEFALSFTAARRVSNSSIQGVDIPLFPGADEKGKTRISELNFAQEWLQRSRQDVLAARSEFSVGIGAFDATVNSNEPDSQFFLWRGQMLYLRRLGKANGQPAVSSNLLVRFNVQLASDSLLSRQQFSLGGQATVRGYRQDALLTDNGIFGSVEARLPILRVPEVEGTLQVTPFIDFGTGWNTNGGTPDPNTLLGVGFGLLWEMGDNFAARLDWGIPLIDVNSGDRTLQENGVYFRLEYRPF